MNKDNKIDEENNELKRQCNMKDIKMENDCIEGKHLIYMVNNSFMSYKQDELPIMLYDKDETHFDGDSMITNVRIN